MIETPRLLIKPFELKDASRLSEYRSKEEVKKYQSWDKYDMNDATERITWCINNPLSDKRGTYQLAVYLKIEDYIIGDLFIEVIDRSRINIGYTFDSPYWSKGYASEAVRALCIYMRDTYHFKKVMAYIYCDNLKSKALLKRLGFMKFDESFFYDDEGYIKKLSTF